MLLGFFLPSLRQWSGMSRRVDTYTVSVDNLGQLAEKLKSLNGVKNIGHMCLFPLNELMNISSPTLRSSV